jgi:hypothetical protein
MGLRASVNTVVNFGFAKGREFCRLAERIFACEGLRTTQGDASY